MRGLYIAVASAAVLAGAVAAVPAAAQRATLGAVSFVPNHNAFGKPFAEWTEQIRKDAQAPVHITIRPSGAMSPFTMGNAVKDGVVDVAYVPFTFYQNLLPVGDAMKLNVKTPAEQRKNGTWAFLNELHNKHVNAYYLGAIGMNVPFHIYLRNKRIEKPDLSGLRLRITPIYRAFFRTLGAEVVQTAPGEVYTALERGVIDGFGWPIWDIKSLGWERHVKYRVDPGFYVTGQAVLVNLNRWKGLSQAQRDYLTRMAIAFENDTWDKAKALNEFYRQEQSKAGIQVIEFKGDQAKFYLETAIKAGWEEAFKLDPVNAPKLKALIE